MKNEYVYMYGMVMSTRSYLLCDSFPKPDGYAEIDKKYFLLGGETGTAAAVLNSYGVPMKLAGSHYGNLNKSIILDYFANTNTDTSELVYEDFDGIIDMVIIDKNTRTVFGEFGKHFSRQTPFYEKPNEESVKNCVCVGTDSFFSDEIGKLCVKYNKKYATIDCDYDSYLNEHCSVNAVSHQYLDDRYSDKSYEELMKLYTENTDGLVIFTLGEKGAMYARKGQEIKYCKACNINAVSTLGAGDCFKAGTIYGLYNGFDDDKLVEYACATAGIACTKFPISINPPKLDEVTKAVKNNYRK